MSDEGKFIAASIDGDVKVIIDLILKGVSPNCVDKLNCTPLYYACSNNHLDVVRILAGYEVDINRPNGQNKETALHAACSSSTNPELMDYLVRHGADVSVSDRDGRSILHYATWFCNMEGIKFAIRHGIAVDSRDRSYFTPLMLLFYAGESCKLKEMYDYLIIKGARIGERATYGHTILHLAINWRRPLRIISFLVQRGLRVGDTTVDGFHALDFAVTYKNTPEIMEFLRKAYTKELPRCGFCEDAPAHIQFKPCHHQNWCAICCGNWKKCACDALIEKKVDIVTAPAERGEPKELQKVNSILTELEEKTTCAICLDRPKALVFNCGHTACQKCSTGLKFCHFCRRPIRRKIKFY